MAQNYTTLNRGNTIKALKQLFTKWKIGEKPKKSKEENKGCI